MEAAAATLAASVCEESSMLDIEKFEKIQMLHQCICL